jgi:hypothetical protein
MPRNLRQDAEKLAHVLHSGANVPRRGRLQIAAMWRDATILWPEDIAQPFTAHELDLWERATLAALPRCDAQEAMRQASYVLLTWRKMSTNARAFVTAEQHDRDLRGEEQK